MEVCEDRYEYSLISIGCEKGDTPACRILCTESDLVTLLESDSFKEDMEPLDLGCELTEMPESC